MEKGNQRSSLQWAMQRSEPDMTTGQSAVGDGATCNLPGLNEVPARG